MSYQPQFMHLEPMLLDSRKFNPFSDPDFLFEIKVDGWRSLAEFGGTTVRLKTRGGHLCTEWFPEVAKVLASFGRGPHVVDGELAVLDDIGRSDFDRFQARALRKRAYPGCDLVTYCVFDVLVMGGVSVMHRPLHERKQMLKGLFVPKPKHGVLVLDAIPEAGLELYAMAVQLELEGLVAKRKDSVYTPGTRSPDWRRIRRPGAVTAQRFRRRG